MEKIFIEKKSEINVEREELLREFRGYLGVESLKDLKIIDCYQVEGASEKELALIVDKIIFDPITDIYRDSFELIGGEKAFRIKDLKGQFNKREHFTKEFINLLVPENSIKIDHSRIILFKGIDDEQLSTIKKYYINPVEFKEVALDDESFESFDKIPGFINWIEGFINWDKVELEKFKGQAEIGMDIEDLMFIKDYFKSEDRDPSLTEIKLIDTYWSDHCRHTTFMTRIGAIEVEEGQYKELFEREIASYLQSRDYVYGEREKALSLMDLATINMKELKKKGLLEDKEETDEINAASIEIDVDVDGKNEKWLLMFKNETHNHPTEMEPFGGAATCLGGAIRDPLSGRAYVYQAMRITGAADPRSPFEETIKGKLAQRKITRTAMKGYSSYGNEIGASTGFIREIYDDGFLAKRMECGALVAAAPKRDVFRGKAETGDVIILVGGRTGKDGLGGAVGSSKEHSEDSLGSGAAEVQKGNPSLERKIIRLFRKSGVSRLIKKCNDFGAGGVGVAIGELADGLVVELDKVPLKYPGLSPMEITLSESQERMACLLDPKDAEEFLKAAREEDLEATIVAQVTQEPILKFIYKGETVVAIKREFLDTNGVEKNADIHLLSPESLAQLEAEDVDINKNLESKIRDLLRDINIGSQKGLAENFDNTVSGGTVTMPYGGEFMLSPSEGMVSKLPVLKGETTTSSIMTFGYDPSISKWSPFHGGYFAVIESLAKIVALGGSYRGVRLSFQEYFERLGEDRSKWGKPFLSLLGAFSIQKSLDIASIGGKDSMSGSFEEIDVPPTLISFAVTTEEIKNIITSEFKHPGNKIILIDPERNKEGLIDPQDLKAKYDLIHNLSQKGLIYSASSVKKGGIIRSMLEMSFGNKIGFKCKDIDEGDMFKAKYGSLVLEINDHATIGELGEFTLLGSTIDKKEIIIDELHLELDSLIEDWTSPLRDIFPVIEGKLAEDIVLSGEREIKIKKGLKVVKPKVLIPVLTGSHGEYTLARSFQKAGGSVEEFVFKTLNPKQFKESIIEFQQKIKTAQILALPHGVSFGGEPGGSGKLLSYILGTAEIKQAMDRFINNTDGLILGVGEGFQALLRSGYIVEGGLLVPNKEGGFVSTMADIEVVNSTSPWFNRVKAGDKSTLPLASYEGRLILESLENLDRSQIATKFIGKNPTGSVGNIESLTSLDSRTLGTIASIDRMDEGLYKNIDIKGSSEIFNSGIKYFD
nr:phosphoribosylformylglycinamidine synthase [Tissierella sp.]